MRFLYLIEQHYAIWFATDSFSELSALIIAHVSRRRTNEAGGGELLLVLRHINAGHHVFIIEEVVREGFRQLGFTHTRCAEENERTNRAFRVLQART